MQGPLSYRMVQFCPWNSGEARINIGVEVFDGPRRFLKMLTKSDVQRRCKTVVGQDPGQSFEVIDELIAFSRESQKQTLDSEQVIELELNLKTPALLRTPERFNNMIRLSEPNRVVYGGVPETADFLLKHLAPVTQNPVQHHVRTRIRNEFFARARRWDGLRSALIRRPRVEVRAQTMSMDFGFKDQQTRMVGRAFNFSREVNESLANELYSMNHLFAGMRRHPASILPMKSDRVYEASTGIGLSVIYSEPTTDRGRELLEAAELEWSELDILATPESEMDLVLEAAHDFVS